MCCISVTAWARPLLPTPQRARPTTGRSRLSRCPRLSLKESRPMTDPELRDLYAEADAYERRLFLARRVAVMIVLTVIAVPLARVVDGRDDSAPSVAVSA